MHMVQMYMCMYIKAIGAMQLHGGALAVGVEGGRPARAADEMDDDVKLMRSWLQAAIPLKGFISCPVKGEEGGFFPAFMQILAVQRKYITVKTYTDDEQLQEPALFEVVVQQFERWAPMSDDPADLGSSAEIF